MLNAHMATKWIPSPKQANVLKVAGEIGLQRTISAVALEARVNRTSIYKWLWHDPGFKNAWDSISLNMLGNHLPGIYSALVRKAVDGDVSAIKLALELAGRYVPTVIHEHKGHLDLSVLSDEDLAGLESVAGKLAQRSASLIEAGGNGAGQAVAN